MLNDVSEKKNQQEEGVYSISRKTASAISPKNIQYDLFTEFFGTPADLSNTMELWDAIPKYTVSIRAQNTLRNAENRLPVHECRFSYASRKTGQRIEHACRVTIQPAAIKTEKGYVDFYPSVDEELVEEVIRKIFAEKNCGIHDPNNAESWVKFSAQMIRKELKLRNKTRSLTEIKNSIDILSKVNISLYLDNTDNPVYSASILSDVTRVTRQDYLEDSSVTWIARLPALVSKSVNELSYRQINYGVLMSLCSQLARWIHRRLTLNYINASIMDSYEVLLSTIQRDSGLLNSTRNALNIKALENALNELRDSKTLQSWESIDVRRQGNKILDIKYRLCAHVDFIKDVKAANARLKQSRIKLSAFSETRDSECKMKGQIEMPALTSSR